MGFFDFLWGKDKKHEPQDASAGYVPVVSDDDIGSDGSDGSGDSGGGDGGGGGGDGGGV